MNLCSSNRIVPSDYNIKQTEHIFLRYGGIIKSFIGNAPFHIREIVLHIVCWKKSSCVGKQNYVIVVTIIAVCGLLQLWNDFSGL